MLKTIAAVFYEIKRGTHLIFWKDRLLQGAPVNKNDGVVTSSVNISGKNNSRRLCKRLVPAFVELHVLASANQPHEYGNH